MNNRFELIPHTADIKIRVYGKNLADLFRNSLIGMFQAIEPEVFECKWIKKRFVCSYLPEKRIIEIASFDLESLLVDFLSEALYLSDVNNEAYLDAEIIHIDKKHIKAIIYGVKISGFEVIEVKAVTYHDLEVKQIDGAWTADIVFDI